MHYGKHVQKKALSEKCWTQDINFYNMDKLVAAENGKQACWFVHSVWKLCMGVAQCKIL